MKRLFLSTLLLTVVLLCNTSAQTKTGDPMILEFNTNLSPGTTIKLPLIGANLTVGWGDGNTETIVSANGLIPHTYSI